MKVAIVLHLTRNQMSEAMGRGFPRYSLFHFMVLVPEENRGDGMVL